MFFGLNRKDSPLHLAVLNDDEALVAKLGQRKELRHAKNRFGFTAVELANYLGKSRCAAILGSPFPTAIKVILKGEKVLTEMTPEDFEKTMGVTYRPFLRFANYSLFKEAIRNCPWMLKSFFLGEENRKLGSLFQAQLFSGTTADVVIKWIDERIGYGVFTCQDFAKGALIGEYTGEVRRLFRSRPDHNAYCFHYPTRYWSLKYFIIDGLREGNALRFINHSDRPNLHPACLVDRGLLHQVFFTNKEIPQGTQLTFDYGEDYWARRSKIREIYPS
jgi:uncharacterized protein